MRLDATAVTSAPSMSPMQWAAAVLWNGEAAPRTASRMSW